MREATLREEVLALYREITELRKRKNEEVEALRGELNDLRSGEYLARVIEERDRYRKALERIAAYDDDHANEYLSKHGSYAGFDEPGSVMVARSTLAVKS